MFNVISIHAKYTLDLVVVTSTQQQFVINFRLGSSIQNPEAIERFGGSNVEKNAEMPQVPSFPSYIFQVRVQSNVSTRQSIVLSQTLRNFSIVQIYVLLSLSLNLLHSKRVERVSVKIVAFNGVLEKTETPPYSETRPQSVRRRRFRNRVGTASRRRSTDVSPAGRVLKLKIDAASLKTIA